MDELTKAVQNALHKHQMLQKGDTVIVACSGGADSVALFHFLFTHAQALGIVLRAAHVNHGLRGAASDADEAFVTRLCAEYAVPLDVTRLRLPANASEGAARAGRYAFFDALAQRLLAKIATAHTQSDNAETVLLHLARGAGVHGAAGIPPVRGCYLRPLLYTTRAQVEHYAAQNKLAYVTDETNHTDAYARNRARRTVLPALETVHAGASAALARFAADMTETAAYLDAQAEALLAQAAAQCPPPCFAAAHEPVYYCAKTLAAAPAPVCKAALRQLVLPWADPDSANLARIYAALRSGGAVQLSAACVLRVAQRKLWLEEQHTSREVFSGEIPFSTGILPLWDGIVLTIRTQSYEDFIKFEKSGNKVLKFRADYDRINGNAVFRTRRPGDCFSPAGRGVTKPLKKIFSEARLSAAARARLPVLACGGTVLWAAGFGFAQCVQPGPGTRTLAEVTLTTQQTEEQKV